MFDRIASRGLGPKLAKAALAGAFRPGRTPPLDPAPPAPPGDGATLFAADYVVRLGALRLGALALRVARAGDAYAATGAARTAGAAGRLLPLDAEASAEGAEGDDGVRPVRAAVWGGFGEERRRIDIAYEPALSVAAAPPFASRPHDADAAALVGALDPLSAAVALLAPRPPASLGPRVLPVFEGRRRAELRVAAPSREGALWRAEAEARPVAGLSPERLARGPFPVRLWWDGVEDAATLLRAEAPTPFGALRVERL